MARNKVQYQKGLSETAFDRHYGSEEQCRAAVAKWRWPDGFLGWAAVRTPPMPYRHLKLAEAHA